MAKNEEVRAVDAVGYCARLQAKLEFAAALVDEAGDHVLGALITEAAEMLATDEDLELYEQRDNLKDAVERADALFYTVEQLTGGASIGPKRTEEFMALVAAWRKAFGSEP
jgi:hypothetical protein